MPLFRLDLISLMLDLGAKFENLIARFQIVRTGSLQVVRNANCTYVNHGVSIYWHGFSERTGSQIEGTGSRI